MKWSFILAALVALIVLSGCGRDDASTENPNRGTAVWGQHAEGMVGHGSSDADPAAVRGKLVKRMGPREVPPVTIGSTKFAAIHWGKSRGFAQNGGYIAAVDATTGEELWTLKIYEVKYDPRKEQDVQDVFIESMSKTATGDNLEIRDEEGRTYVVNPRTRVVQVR